MQAILRSRIPADRHKPGAPIRIEISAPVKFTEADCIHAGRFRSETARKLALAEFAELFGESLIKMATAPRAVWSMEVI